ncbi:MAG: cyclic nucleotide-binding domain-containing protein [Thermoanaerobaculia bacterium]|nr:cyclic nucleotide-binding domain-containing protein [Thermoanaerobaculia bacterium]
MSEPQHPPVDLKLIGSLAKRFSERQMFDEAADLFTLALRFEPKNRAFQLGLADVRKRQKQAQGRRERSAEEALREHVRRDAIDASHFLGLATLYEQRGKREQAVECLEIARSKDVINPALHKLRGRILFQRQEFDDAAEELRTAARYNPFDREVFELLGRVEYERESYLDALEADIDAFLLLDDDDRENAERLKKRIRALKALRKISSQDLVELFRERRERLQTAFDRLEWQRKTTLNPPSTDAPSREARPKGDQIAMAARLRQLAVWSNLEDDQIFQLAQTVRAEQYERTATIFKNGSRGTEIYIVESGKVAIRRPTHYGTIDLGTLDAGKLFGELNFISRYERSGDAVAAEDSTVLTIDPEELEALISEEPTLGVQVYLSFWRSLARKLRASNEQLKTFFAGGAIPEKLLKLRSGARPEGGQVEVKSDDKIRLFREQGLTGDELTTLANFSSVRRFPGGTYLFHEGDEGKTMYVVLEGKVMISKYLPGGGEEALAILPRGDFFGEMSLIDGEPRSADAKAMGGPVTVVELEETTFKEVMGLDPHAALELMKLLCRLIAKRLREIDEKLTTWSIFDGGRVEGQAIEWESPAQSRTA